MNRILLSIAILATTFVANANAICHHRAMQMQFAAVRVAQPYFVAPAYIPAPAPAPVYHQYQTIGGPAPTMVFDSAPVYGQPITESAPAYQQVQQVQVQHVAPPVAVQAAPIQTVQVQAAPVQTVEVQAAPIQTVQVQTATPAVETIPVEATHSVAQITEAPIAVETSVAVEAVQTVQVPAVQTVQVPAAQTVQVPVQTVQVPVQTYQVAAPAPQATFVQTPPAARANVIETTYQPQTMYFQPAPVMMMIQPAPARGGCLGCRHR